MALFPLSGVLRGFQTSTYSSTPQPENLVRPSSAKKLLIFKLETNSCQYTIIFDKILLETVYEQTSGINCAL